MKKISFPILAFFALLLATLSIVTINTKKSYASTSNMQTPVYQIGSTVDDFTLKNIDGNMVSLSSLNTPGVIVIFTCNHCPYAKAYESRIIALNKKYKALGYPVIAINPNKIGEGGEDGMDENKILAHDKGFDFPYLKDDAQTVTNAFGAKRTPTAYVLKRDNGKYILKYAGAIDNNSQSEVDVTKNYIDQAIGELLLGKNVSVNTAKAIGCGIKFKNT